MKQKIQIMKNSLIESHRQEPKYCDDWAVEAITVHSKYIYKYARKHYSIKAGVGPRKDETGSAATDTYAMTEILQR